MNQREDKAEGYDAGNGHTVSRRDFLKTVAGTGGALSVAAMSGMGWAAPAQAAAGGFDGVQGASSVPLRARRAGELPYELWRWTGTELAHGIRTRQISSREATQSCLARIEQVNPYLNALVEVTPHEALRMADAADRAVAAGVALGPLHGVPVSIKAATDQAGRATTDGIVANKDNIAESDAPHVANLRAGGATFVGRSNTPAFSFRWFTNNDLHGRTLNPWDASRTPGGSSGGASSAVASGMQPIAQGSDIGGSIRYPAYACGVTGIRPTAERVPSTRPGDERSLSSQLMSVQGPLARSVADLRIALDSMAGYALQDYSVVAVPPASINEPLPQPPRVGLLRDVGVATPQSAVNEALDRAAGQLRNAGYVVEEIELPLLGEAYRLWYLLVMEDFRQNMPLVEEIGDYRIKRAADTYYAAAKQWWGPEPGLDDLLSGYARRGTIIRQLEAFMQDYPLVLLPVSAEQAFEYDADIASIESGLRTVAAQWPSMAIPTIGFPAISVPTGVIGGLPTGVQLLGRRFREDEVFDAAEAIEAQSGVFTPVDP